MSIITFRIQSAGSLDAAQLIAALDEDLAERNPGHPLNGINIDEFENSGGVFAVGYVGEDAASCGAIRPYMDAAEIKRMFVKNEFRRRGLGRRMLLFLEEESKVRGFARGLLETSERQVEAIQLYSEAGWRPISTFGPYVGNPISRCFEKLF